MKKTSSLLVAALCLAATACGSATTPTSPGDDPADTATTMDTVIPINAASSYREHCSACHGSFGGGEPGGSEITNVPLTYDPASLEEVIRNGIGTMPGTPNLPDEDVALIVEYVLNDFSVVPQDS